MTKCEEDTSSSLPLVTTDPLVTSKSATNLTERGSPVESKATLEDGGEDVAMLQNDPQAKQLKDYPRTPVSMSANLTPNTYSILYVCPPKSMAFVFSIIFFLFQVTLASLALIDLIDVGSGNLLKVPANIEGYVRAAGYLAMILAVPLFTDLLDSIERMHEGYHPMVTEQSAHATQTKFWLAYGCQFVSGALFQVVIFILIVQSTTVIGMLLNFAALQFITEVDDVAFSLAERGYFSKSIQNSCAQVQELKTPDDKEPWLRRIAFFVVVTVVAAGYSVVYSRQYRGEFLCNRIQVQFGDSAWPDLPLYSGVYYVDRSKRENGRFVYGDEISYDPNDSGVSYTSIFRYCNSQSSWVFGYFALGLETNDIDDYYDLICKDYGWFAKSPSTNSFDILNQPSSDWFTSTQQDNALVFPVDHFVLSCLDCKEDTCNSIGGRCEFNPNLSAEQVCVCNEGYYGNECQYNLTALVCPSLTFDRRFGAFQAGGISYPTQFDLVMDPTNGSPGSFLDLYNKTVYSYTYPQDDINYGFLVVIAYLGRRYFFLEVDWLRLLPNATVDTAAAEYVNWMRNNREAGFFVDELFTFPYNGTFSSVIFSSDPLNLGTAQDTLMPTNLGWYYSRVDDVSVPLAVGPSVSARLLCEECNDWNVYCGDFGNCDFSRSESAFFGKCNCTENFVGPQCEVYAPEQVVQNQTQQPLDTESDNI